MTSVLLYWLSLLNHLDNTLTNKQIAVNTSYSRKYYLLTPKKQILRHEKLTCPLVALRLYVPPRISHHSSHVKCLYCALAMFAVKDALCQRCIHGGHRSSQPMPQRITEFYRDEAIFFFRFQHARDNLLSGPHLAFGKAPLNCVGEGLTSLARQQGNSLFLKWCFMSSDKIPSLSHTLTNVNNLIYCSVAFVPVCQNVAGKELMYHVLQEQYVRCMANCSCKR